MTGAWFVSWLANGQHMTHCDTEDAAMAAERRIKVGCADVVAWYCAGWEAA